MRPVLVAALTLSLGLALLAPSAQGQQEGPSVGSASEPAAAAAAAGIGAGPTIADLRTRLQSLENDEDISAERKARLLELYRGAVANLERVEALRAEATRLGEELQRAPERRARIRSALAAPTAPANVVPAGESVTLEAAETGLREAESALATARQKVQEFSEAAARNRQAPTEIQTGINAARDRLARIAEERSAPQQQGLGAAEEEAMRASLAARQRLRTTEVNVLQQQLAAQDAILPLLTDELALAQREAGAAQARAEAWREVVQRQRQRQAAEQARLAQEQEAALAQMPESVRRLAERNTAYAETLRQLATKEAQASERLSRVEARVTEVEDDLASVQQRIELVGLNETLALVLRQQREALPSRDQYEARSREIRAETSWAAGLQIDVEDARRSQTDPARDAARVLEAIQPPMPEVIRTYLLPRVTEVLRQQKEFADRLHEASGRYIKQLGALENAERSLVLRAETFNALIDEHLLWIRSAPLMSLTIAAQTTTALEWLLSPGAWGGLLQDAYQSLLTDPILWVPGMALFVLLVLFRPYSARVLRDTASGVGRARRDSFKLTLQALLATLLLSIAVPLLPAVVGWPLTQLDDAFARAVGNGLLAVALISIGFSVLGTLTRAGGIGDVHFGWPTPARRAVRVQLRWLLPLLIGLGFVIWATEASDDDNLRGSLGRIAFVLAMLALAVFNARLLAPGGPLIAALLARGADSLAMRTRYLWAPAAIAAPVTLALLSLGGYHYSALQLQNRLQATAWLVIGLIVASETLMRWVYVTQRRMAYEQAREERLAQRRERLEAQRAQETEADAGPDDVDGLEVAEPEVSHEQVRDQAGSVVRTIIGTSAVIGLWIIWAAVLPALGVLNEVSLWLRPDLVDGIEVQVPVTLVDLGLAALVAFIAWVSTSNLPGALELAVLNRTSMDAGAKYAFTSMCRYVIAGVGVIAVFNLLGMQWSQLQWLLAALSVGLGFGLQEIVANFVSGIILLFERPIRVGDIVTVNGKDGIVSRIQIRATTLTDWDRKELIIPNKVFITGDVINWTLTNSTNRILIPVGIAYGADAKLAIELLHRIAAEHPRILDDPGPIATFEGFGDNTLNLFLRCYMPNLDGRLGVITELYTAINAEFSAAGISIAFPQRDVHLDTSRPLQIELSRARRAGAPQPAAAPAGS